MKKIAIYGKGGIGKSTTTANVSAALSEQGLKVCQIGCDPKNDSTRLLLGRICTQTVLDVVRDKEEHIVQITLKNEQGTTKVLKDADMEILGAAFKPISKDLMKQLNLGYGLQVTAVTKGKMADAGITKGFIILKVNGQSMKSVDDLEKTMKSASKSTEPVLWISGVFPSGKRGIYAVDLTQE